MSKHDFIREEFKTDFESLQNSHFVIYCRYCGYVSYDTNLGNNDKRQENIPKQCGSKEKER